MDAVLGDGFPPGHDTLQTVVERREREERGEANASRRAARNIPDNLPEFRLEVKPTRGVACGAGAIALY
jgi:hypothetical protein